MEDTFDDAVDGALGIDALVVPAGDELGNYPFQDLRCDLAGWLVEDLDVLINADFKVQSREYLHWRNDL